MASRLPISTAPRDGTLIRFWCHSEVEAVIGYWSRTFIGWMAYHEPIPLIRHDVTGWEPIADQAAARAVPLEQARRAGAHDGIPSTTVAPARSWLSLPQLRRPSSAVGRGSSG